MKLHTSFHYIRWKEGSGGSRTSSLTSSTSPLSAMSDNRISTKGCWRLNAAPRRYFSERVVLLAKKTLLLAIASRLGPIGHDTPTDETYHLLIPIPTVKHQSISVVRAVIDGKLSELHNLYPCVGSRSFRFERGRFFNSASVFLESTLQAPPSLSHRAMAAICWLASV